MKLCRNLYGDIIKRKRQILNLSQEDVVSEVNLLGLDLNQSDLSRIESFKRPIYDYEFYWFCKVLDLNIDSFKSKDIHSVLSKITPIDKKKKK